mgnify:CR=1 FL=1
MRGASSRSAWARTAGFGRPIPKTGFRGNIEDPVSLHLAKEFCPGIPKEISHADFAAQGRRYLQENGLLANDGSCEANALILDK